MESTLSQLLAIQGKPEQQSMDEVFRTPETLQKPAGALDGVECGEERTNDGKPREGPPRPSEGLQDVRPAASGKTSPAMLEAWRMAFKIFTRYAPILRHAAGLDDENAAAMEAFEDAAAEVEELYKIGGDAEILALRVYDMLGDVFDKARQGGGE